MCILKILDELLEDDYTSYTDFAQAVGNVKLEKLWSLCNATDTIDSQKMAVNSNLNNTTWLMSWAAKTNVSAITPQNPWSYAAAMTSMSPVTPQCWFSVGCIYASNPRFKSNIFQCHFLPSNPLSNNQNNLEIFSLFFSVFLLTLVLMSFLFLCIIYCAKVHLFALTSRFDSKLRKHQLAHWLYPMIWFPNAQGTKGLG